MIANFDFAAGYLATFTGLAMDLSEAISSLIRGWSGEGSSWTLSGEGSSWMSNLMLLVEILSRTSNSALSGSSVRDTLSWSSAGIPLSGNSLMPQRLFSSISRSDMDFRSSG